MAQDLGAIWLNDDRCRFRVWAPHSETVHLHLVQPRKRLVPMETGAFGYHQAVVENLKPGTQYFYRLSSGKDYPDPASRYQPEGVHGPSEAVKGSFNWNDAHWTGTVIENYVIYELHVGTFTAEGTFDAAIPHLSELAGIGVTAIELMPIAQFSGARNWGYDGVYPFAVQNSYGGPSGLKRFVNACHQLRLAVILDVVYNHIGLEGNYLPHFGPYFTDRYKTPWGPAVNYDDAHSDHVRDFFIANALEWITDYHIDALRLDAIHAIFDHSGFTYLEELGEAVRQRALELNRCNVHVIAESALNDTRIIRPRELGGYGLHAQWNDDFHHSLHTLLTRERDGYYADFGSLQHMARAFSDGFVYSGQYSASRGRRHGNSSRSIAPAKFVVYAQTHDQVGNRMMGERLSKLVSFEASKLAASAVLLSPFVPLLFMGEEYGETAPFLYFISHSDAGLIEGVRRGRKKEFEAFLWQGEPPDPQDEHTFERSKLNHALKTHPHHHAMLQLHKELIRLRKTQPALRCLSKDNMEVAGFDELSVLTVRRWSGSSEVLAIFNFTDGGLPQFHNLPCGAWRKRFDSAESRWMGPGAIAPVVFDKRAALPLQPYGVLLYEKEMDDG